MKNLRELHSEAGNGVYDAMAAWCIFRSRPDVQTGAVLDSTPAGNDATNVICNDVLGGNAPPDHGKIMNDSSLRLCRLFRSKPSGLDVQARSARIKWPAECLVAEIPQRM